VFSIFPRQVTGSGCRTTEAVFEPSLKLKPGEVGASLGRVGRTVQVGQLRPSIDGLYAEDSASSFHRQRQRYSGNPSAFGEVGQVALLLGAPVPMCYVTPAGGKILPGLRMFSGSKTRLMRRWSVISVGSITSGR